MAWIWLSRPSHLEFGTDPLYWIMFIFMRGVPGVQEMANTPVWILLLLRAGDTIASYAAEN
jgi:hypothetical protein